MATGSQILTEQQKTAADVATLQGNVTALLTAFANGSITPADAQTILNNATAEDASVVSMNTAIAAALNPPAPPAAG